MYLLQCQRVRHRGFWTGHGHPGADRGRQDSHDEKYKARKFLAYFQSFTNTYTSVENMREMYDAAFSCKGVVGMAVGTRPGLCG